MLDMIISTSNSVILNSCFFLKLAFFIPIKIWVSYMVIMVGMVISTSNSVILEFVTIIVSNKHTFIFFPR